MMLPTRLIACLLIAAPAFLVQADAQENQPETIEQAALGNNKKRPSSGRPFFRGPIYGRGYQGLSPMPR